MNRLMIIGNLTRDPELRTTTAGDSVCSFSVAVNRRRRRDEQDVADYFNVSAWRELGENCAKYLAKGRKVCVIGPVSNRVYQRSDGSYGASMEIQASEVEFLTPKGDQPAGNAEAARPAEEKPATDPSGLTPVDPGDDLPF